MALMGDSQGWQKTVRLRDCVVGRTWHRESLFHGR
jgi:hypothetical protein